MKITIVDVIIAMLLGVGVGIALSDRFDKQPDNITNELKLKDSLIQARELHIKTLMIEVDSLKKADTYYSNVKDSLINDNYKLKTKYEKDKKDFTDVTIISNDSITKYISNILQNWE